jgi:hypothetical protein
VSGDAVHQPTWPLSLKIEHMVKLQVLGNNSKTVNNIKNLTWGKNDHHIKIYLPCNFEVNLITHLAVIALFSSTILIISFKPFAADTLSPSLIISKKVNPVNGSVFLLNDTPSTKSTKTTRPACSEIIGRVCGSQSAILSFALTLPPS